jgi:hypothetical protein
MQRVDLRERLRETEVIDAWSKIVGFGPKTIRDIRFRIG